jgi:hypothetical protein
MKVKELIALLSKFDGEMKVAMWDYEVEDVNPIVSVELAAGDPNLIIID